MSRLLIALALSGLTGLAHAQIVEKDAVDPRWLA